MNKFKFALMALAGFAFLTACEEEEDNNDINFAPYTVEQNKANLEEQGLKMIDEGKAMQEMQTWGVAESMVHFMDIDDPEEFRNTSGKYLLQPILIGAAVRKNNVSFVGKQLKSMLDEPETLAEMWDEITGIYTWNNETQEWDTEDTGDEVIFHFPSTENGTTNNAEFKIYDFDLYTGTFAYEDEVEELPVKLVAELKVDNNELMSFLYQTNIDNQGYVTRIELTFTVENYTWSTIATYTPHSKGTFEESFKKGNEVLIGAYLSAEGSFNSENVEVAIDEEVPEDILDKLNAKLQVMNIAMEGMVNVDPLASAMRQYENEENDETVIKGYVAALNAHTSLYIKYVDLNQVIAYVQFKAIKEVDTWTEWEYNYETNSWYEVTVTEEYWDMMPQFKFADGSLMDADLFFETGFEDFEDEMEEWLGDVDWDK
mgnify:CR=1 FL=1